MPHFSPAKLIVQAADRLGYDIRPKWRMVNLPLAQRLETLFGHFGITAVIDVGGNKGEFRDILRHEANFKGQIYSFEPDPDMVEILQSRAAQDPAWTVFPMALGAAAGTMAFNIMRDPVYNSFSAPNPGQATGHEKGNTVVQTIDVEVRTLDQMAGSFPDLARTYLKIDTQGHDLEVIRGGMSVVGLVPALQTEVSTQPIYQGSPSMDESIGAIRALGFAIADLFLVSTDGHNRAVEFDCVMIRDAPAA